MTSELDALRQETEQLKNQIRVSLYFVAMFGIYGKSVLLRIVLDTVSVVNALVN